MNLENLKKLEIGMVLVSTGTGERVKIKAFERHHSPASEDGMMCALIKPYSPDALGHRVPYPISLKMIEMYYDIEENETHEEE